MTNIKRNWFNKKYIAALTALSSMLMIQFSAASLMDAAAIDAASPFGKFKTAWMDIATKTIIPVIQVLGFAMLVFGVALIGWYLWQENIKKAISSSVLILLGGMITFSFWYFSGNLGTTTGASYEISTVTEELAL